MCPETTYLYDLILKCYLHVDPTQLSYLYSTPSISQRKPVFCLPEIEVLHPEHRKGRNLRDKGNKNEREEKNVRKKDETLYVSIRYLFMKYY